jgi:hypothetical protein
MIAVTARSHANVKIGWLRGSSSTSNPPPPFPARRAAGNAYAHGRRPGGRACRGVVLRRCVSGGNTQARLSVVAALLDELQATCFCDRLELRVRSE